MYGFLTLTKIADFFYLDESDNVDINLLPHSSAFDFQLMYATKSYSHYFLSHRLKTNFFCSEALKKVALYLIMILKNLCVKNNEN